MGLTSSHDQTHAKAHQNAYQIRDEDEDPDAIIKFGRCLRVSENALTRFVRRNRYPRG
jgi:hypothetical protein